MTRIQIPAPNTERIEDYMDKRRSGYNFIQGVVNGAIMRALWDERNRKRKKDLGYLTGNVVSALIIPTGIVNLAIDAIRGNYTDISSYFDKKITIDTE